MSALKDQSERFLFITTISQNKALATTTTRVIRQGGGQAGLKTYVLSCNNT